MQNYYRVAKMICRNIPKDLQLCEMCGRTYFDKIPHFSRQCDNTVRIRDQLWDYLTDTFDASISAILFNLEKEEFIDSLVRAPVPCNIDEETALILFKMFIDFFSSKISLEY